MSARRLLARRRVVADDASKRMDRPILERCSMTTYAVLQKQPPEALDDRADEWRYGVVDVLSVGTQVGAETFAWARRVVGERVKFFGNCRATGAGVLCAYRCRGTRRA
jgi:hypothetical protein